MVVNLSYEPLQVLHDLNRCNREYVTGMKPRGCTSQSGLAAYSLHLMLVIIIIMKTEKRQAKNLPRPQEPLFRYLRRNRWL